MLARRNVSLEVLRVEERFHFGAKRSEDICLSLIQFHIKYLNNLNNFEISSPNCTEFNLLVFR